MSGKDFEIREYPLERVAKGFDALDSGYRLDGRDAIKIAIQPNGG